jgi:hypothetical protein
MSTCKHSLPLTLRPMMLFRGKNGDPAERVIMTQPGTTLAEVHHAIRLMESEGTGAAFRVAFAAEVRSEDEAERYHAGHWSDEAGNAFAIFEPPTKDGICPHPECSDDLHAIGCPDCDRVLGVFVHASGLSSSQA